MMKRELNFKTTGDWSKQAIVTRMPHLGFLLVTVFALASDGGSVSDQHLKLKLELQLKVTVQVETQAGLASAFRFSTWKRKRLESGQLYLMCRLWEFKRMGESKIFSSREKSFVRWADESLCKKKLNLKNSSENGETITSGHETWAEHVIEDVFGRRIESFHGCHEPKAEEKVNIDTMASKRFSANNILGLHYSPILKKRN